MEDVEQLRNDIRNKMSIEELSLRDIGKITEISPSTLSRFLRGRTVTFRNIRCLHRWITGMQVRKPKKKVIKRFSINNKSFLVTIEEV